MTYKAVRILSEVQQVLAEDTRTSKRLLDHFEVKTPLRSFHAHNEHKVLDDLVSQLESGADYALVTDAGTPGISDPGFLLVRACVEKGIKVECLPGATAFVPALVASGIPCDRFHYEGFLPHKKGRNTRLKYLATLPNTFVLYESPYRLIKCLEELKAHCGGERKACVCRELTKLHEEVNTNSIDALIEDFKARPSIKGEIVVVVEGKE
jgi:16S rRNA (cytidine1402-2'-O)-methyltransferase